MKEIPNGKWTNDTSKIRAVSICEDDIYEYYEFDSESELRTYSSGFSAGASAYGAGGASVYTLEDLEDIDPEEESELYEMIKEALE